MRLHLSLKPAPLLYSTWTLTTDVPPGKAGSTADAGARVPAAGWGLRGTGRLGSPTFLLLRRAASCSCSSQRLAGPMAHLGLSTQSSASPEARTALPTLALWERHGQKAAGPLWAPPPSLTPRVIKFAVKCSI